ncbi:hypothetical protein SAMD00019534_003640 [Acytostelium subglobosum LB1]|uniref:hypothetical protein n=1 Tax=Acytostelium subglobosum LB1 TaxID=1410327 RepID=UPI0006448FE8|nr:hypothetical protein SAMD00019534_003640 [Acytostelium subglobosum LB1]GAM17189.1 hypothetical protein SAMD00019534_003640 [Acytostelium subglobosum LB1]|eukprot:XP_012759251.1 hypothetical protein SAMD00019534_003640 [Acytostelium subglobosum LB1]
MLLLFLFGGIGVVFPVGFFFVSIFAFFVVAAVVVVVDVCFFFFSFFITVVGVGMGFGATILAATCCAQLGLATATVGGATTTALVGVIDDVCLKCFSSFVFNVVVEVEVEVVVVVVVVEVVGVFAFGLGLRSIGKEGLVGRPCCCCCCFCL